MTNCSFYDIKYLDDIGDIERDIEFIEVKKKIEKIDNETQTDFFVENSNNDNNTGNNDEINYKIQDNTDTNLLNTNDFLSEIDMLKTEITSLNIKNSRLEKNFKEICNLLVMFTKIDVENPEIDKIRRQLTILVNRELRMNYAFPFVNLLSNIK